MTKEQIQNLVTLLGGRQIVGPTLTAAEENHPLAAMFNAPMAEPNPVSVAQISEELPDSSVVTFEQKDLLLSEEYQDTRVGHKLLADGSGYVQSYVRVENATPEMYNWYFVWFPFEDIRYKVWDPKCHFTIRITDETKAQLLGIPEQR
ncbi:hypothetical protein CKF54_06540, partial [Psittacicella hinzii]